MGWKNLSIVQFKNIAFLYFGYGVMTNSTFEFTNRNPNASFNIKTLKLMCEC